GAVEQSGRRPNPEFELESENMGGSLNGFRETEITVLLSQELELWGQRGARRNAANRDRDFAIWQAKAAASDVCAETRIRFYELIHAQNQVELAVDATELASEVTDAARIRMEKGAAPPSELLLSEMELESARLELAEAETEIENARLHLAAMWNGNDTIIAAVDDDLPGNLPPVDILMPLIERSRPVIVWSLEKERLEALLGLERANGKPNLTLSGGLKRSEADKANSFVAGISLPIPVFDRNQGNVKALAARLEEVTYEWEQSSSEAEAELSTILKTLDRLRSSHAALDTLILPKAMQVFESLRHAYENGRTPYSEFLEGERRLIDVRSQHLDVHLQIRREAVALERLLGISLDDLSVLKGE
ncbi:MAG: TolC family protein, partial [candidate division Zixibacteria bacterium]|nr:TolC family protein [candidate division Zixibacteria bacterium]